MNKSSVQNVINTLKRSKLEFDSVSYFEQLKMTLILLFESLYESLQLPVSEHQDFPGLIPQLSEKEFLALKKSFFRIRPFRP